MSSLKRLYTVAVASTVEDDKKCRYFMLSGSFTGISFECEYKYTMTNTTSNMFK